MAAVRLAVVSDGDLIHELVRRSYSIYLDRLDRPPAPMLVDHTDRIRDKAVWVIGQPLAGIIVLTPTDHAMQIDNVAVDPDQQGRGLGRTLLAFAEELALRRGFSATELYTNEAMTENVALYRRLGYDEVDRRAEDGYRRVYMRKGLK